VPISISPILDGESGISVRTKLNQLINGASGGGFLPEDPPDGWFDFDPPNVPQNLTLTSVALPSPKLVATWEPAGDTDLAYYDLQMKEGSGGWVSFQTSAERYEFAVRPGIVFTARIRAIDTSGNKSAFSGEVVHTTKADDVPPAMPIGVLATAGFGTIWLEWIANTESDLFQYEIFESSTASPAPEETAEATYTSFSPTFVLTGLENGQTLHYWVRAVDTSGNRSVWSAPVSATTTTIQPIDIVGAVNLTSIAAGLTLPGLGSALPPTPFTDETPKEFYLTTDKKLYVQKADASGWIVQTDASLVVGQLVAGQISAGAIGTNQLAAGAVRAKHLLVTDFYNFITDPFFADPTSGEFSLAVTASYISTGGNPYNTSTTALGFSGATGYTASRFVPCVPGNSYCIETVMMHTGATAGTVNAAVWFQNEAGDALVSQFLVSFDTTDPAFTWIKKTAAGVCPAGAVKMRLVFSNTPITGQFRCANVAFYRQTDSVLIKDGSITASKVMTNEIIAYAANIKDSVITNAKIVSLNAAKIEAGSILSGEVIVGGRSIGSLNTEMFADDFSSAASGTPVSATPVAGHTWIQWADGPADIIAVAAAQSGPNVLRLLNYNWLTNKAARIPYDPNKMYRIRVRVRRTTGSVAGLMYIGVQGLKGDGVTAVSTAGVDGTNQGHWVVTQGFPSTSLPAGAAWATYEGYIKGVAAAGTGVANGTAGGTIAAPCQMHSNTRFISPVIVSNLGGGDHTIQVDYFAIHQVDEDAANIVNAGTVKITPGQIQISGATTLADWRQGGDTTKIAGGAISANTIEANKITVGARGVTLENIEFEHNSPSANRVSWTAGNVRYIDDAGAVAVAAIAASNAPWSGAVLYIYWVKGAATLSTTTVAATAFGQNNIVLATYQGGVNLVSTYGRTIIDGSNIKTGTIEADRIKSYNLTADNATFGNVNISNANIGTLQVGTSNIVAGAVSVINLDYGAAAVTKVTNSATDTDVSSTAHSGAASMKRSITFFCTGSWKNPVGPGYSPYDGPRAYTFTFKLKRNGTTIKTVTKDFHYISGPTSGGGEYRAFFGDQMMKHLDTTGGATATYSVTVAGQSGVAPITFDFIERSLEVLELKR